MKAQMTFPTYSSNTWSILSFFYPIKEVKHQKVPSVPSKAITVSVYRETVSVSRSFNRISSSLVLAWLSLMYKSESQKLISLE